MIQAPRGHVQTYQEPLHFLCTSTAGSRFRGHLPYHLLTAQWNYHQLGRAREETEGKEGNGEEEGRKREEGIFDFDREYI